MEERIKEELARIVGQDNLSDKLIDLIAYSYDASSLSGRPDLAVWVESTDQVSKLLALADQERIPVMARGAGTGLCGLSVPARGGIVMDMARMNRILEVSIPDRLVVVQPGVVYAELQKALAPEGFFFPPDPASGQMCTLGGNVATNAGGLRAAKYGVTRDYVLGLEVVLADGSIMRTGTRTIKSSSGLDLTRLFVGSEGTLGVVTEVTLKISPLPKEITTAMASFDRLEDAGGAVTGLMHSGVIPAVLELLDKATINLFREHSDLDLPEVEAMILLEVHGNTPDDVAFQMERTAEVFSACQVRELKVARTEEEAERLWLVRKSIGGLTGKISASQAPEDVTVPMSRITDFLRRSEEISQKHGLLILNYGHAGDGNLHPNVLYDQADPDQVARMERALTELHELAVELKGTLTGEHGIGLTKAAHMHLEHDPVAMRTMRAIKRTLDPHNILNPGKMDLEG